MAKTQRETDLKDIEEANAIEEGLTDWEMNYIDSLNKWMKTNETLTETQRGKLDQILRERG